MLTIIAAALAMLVGSDPVRPVDSPAKTTVVPDSSNAVQSSQPKPSEPMQLGAFSISLAVKDIKASIEFYEKLGFQSFGGNPAQNWAILKNGDHIIGLFQGMFEKNILTFNPGWDQDAKEINPFTDVRQLQKQLKAQGVTVQTEVDENGKGPGSFIVVDPDGNPVLVDQHR